MTRVNDNKHAVGLHREQIDTPALLIDLPAMERNLNKMALHLSEGVVKLRPHVKLYKGTPALAHLQLEAGAIGVTCARLSEAETLAATGIRNILIANQVVGAGKIERLIKLAAYSDIMVAVDSYDNVRELSQAAQASGVVLGVLVEVDIGNARCGVEPFEPALRLSWAVHNSPGLRYMGLMGYCGNIPSVTDPAERPVFIRKMHKILVDTAAFIEQTGIEVKIVSGGGTITYKDILSVKGITEIQAGTYLLMDTHFQDIGAREFECTLTVLGTVISRPQRKGSEDMAVIDVGRKWIDPIYGLPQIKTPLEASLISLSQEHSRLKLSGKATTLKVGDMVELMVGDANGTINLHSRFYAIRNDIVEAIWEIPKS